MTTGWLDEVVPSSEVNEVSKASSMRDDRVADHAAELRSDLVDLTGLCLDQIDDLPETVLASSLRRILRENQEQPSAYTQYSANI
jgi:FXSXX-COOH protein